MADELPGYGDDDQYRSATTQAFLDPLENNESDETLPSYVDLVDGPQEAKRVLSLHGGGGVRVLSQLYMLKRLLKGEKPCEAFDLIPGTGTGGIIAIMLGRMMMVFRFW